MARGRPRIGEESSNDKQSAQTRSVTGRISKKTCVANSSASAYLHHSDPQVKAYQNALNQSVAAVIDPSLLENCNQPQSTLPNSLNTTAIDPALDRWNLDQQHFARTNIWSVEQRAASVGYAEVGGSDLDAHSTADQYLPIHDAASQFLPDDSTLSQYPVIDNPANQYPLAYVTPDQHIPALYPVPQHVFTNENAVRNIPTCERITIAAAAATATLEQFGGHIPAFRPNLQGGVIPRFNNAAPATPTSAISRVKKAKAATDEQLKVRKARGPPPPPPEGGFRHPIIIIDHPNINRTIPTAINAIREVIDGTAEFELASRTEEGHFRSVLLSLTMILAGVECNEGRKLVDLGEIDAFECIKYTVTSMVPGFDIIDFNAQDIHRRPIRFRLIHLYRCVIATQLGSWDAIQPAQWEAECELEVRRRVMETLTALTVQCHNEVLENQDKMTPAQQHHESPRDLEPIPRPRAKK